MVGNMHISHAVRRIEDLLHNINNDFKNDSSHDEHLGWALRLPEGHGPVLRGVGLRVSTATTQANAALMALLARPLQFEGTQKICRYKDLGRGGYTEKGKLLHEKESKKIKHILKDLEL
jgi:hypothetical protein